MVLDFRRLQFIVLGPRRKLLIVARSVWSCGGSSDLERSENRYISQNQKQVYNLQVLLQAT